MTNTPRRTFRIPDWIWVPAQSKADRLGIPLSSVVRAALRAWVKDERRR